MKLDFTSSITICKFKFHIEEAIMAIERQFWFNRIEEIWKKRSIVWLAGVRRSGKTTLAKSFSNATYVNCDLPSERRRLEDPESFYQNLESSTVVFDEIHQLTEASQVLKIGADHFKSKKILATGSSTLFASKKFKDSLTDRKRDIHFLPVLVSELENFSSSLKRRILHGGLPPSLMNAQLDHEFFAEWMDSFYARDIQELFAVERRQPFLKVLEYLLISNGNQFEVAKLAQASGVSRPTVIKYLDILETTKAVTLIRPFSRNSLKEIVSQPKVYGFDTGFSCFAKGIKELRNEDYGQYLENLTLETLQSLGLNRQIQYWRTKSQNEIDFVLSLSKDENLIIECKWQEKHFDDYSFRAFRKDYPRGLNIVVTSDSKRRVSDHKGIKIHFVNIYDLQDLIKTLIQ